MPNWKKVITSGSAAHLDTIRASGIENAGGNTDQFLVLDSDGNIKFRTGANMAEDLNITADGGNADTVDTLHASSFIRSDADDNVSGHTEWQDSKEVRLGAGADFKMYHNGTNTFLINETGNLTIRQGLADGNLIFQNDDGSGGNANYVVINGSNENIQLLKPVVMSGLSAQGSEATSLMINSSNEVGTRELGSLAFSSATYDNYSSWNLKTDGTQRTTVTSGGDLDIIGGTNVSISYAANGRVTITSTDTDTVYTHPTHPGDDISVDTGALTGATVISDLDFNVTTDTLGHVTDANGTVFTRDLTLSDLGYTGDTDANNYTLPLATNTVRGGVELFSNTDQSVAANAVTTTAGRTYGIQLNSDNQMVVNVPWTDTNTVYTHPSHNGDDIDIDTTALTGATVISDLDFNVTTDGLGHVTDANGTVSTRDLTLADLGYTGATDANNYSHPTHNGDDIDIDTTALTGATVISDLDFNITTNGLGHVTDANGTVSTRDLTLSDLGYTGDTDANNYSLTLSLLNTVTSGMTGTDTLTFGDSGNDTNVIIKGDLEVKGTTVTNNVETVSTSNGVVFEGTALDNNEGTLLATTLTADRTYTLPNKSGTVAMTSDITGTNSGTNTGDEPDASTTVKGIVELATTAETTTGTDATRAVTPDGLKDGYQGSTNVTTLGTITTGTWNGSAISTTYISNLSGTNTGDEPDASTTVKGIVELATTAETTTGTDATRAVTPDGLKDGYQGSSNVTTLGTISTGTWQGTAIASAYLDSDTAHLSGTQTFTGTKTFNDLRAAEYIYHASDTDTFLRFLGDKIQINAGGVQMLTLTEGTTDTIVFNEDSNDIDFRVESNNDTHMLFVDGGNDRLGIGTSTPSSKVEIYASGSTVFDVQGSQGQLFSVVDDLSGDLFSVADISGVPILAVSASGIVEVDENLHVVTSLGVGTEPSTTSGEIRATGDITAYYSSDERLKDNITPIESPIEKLKQINGVTFDWIPNSDVHSHEGRDVGVIAQEIEKVLPEIVTTRKTGYKAVQYEKIIALLIESNKELLARVEELEEKIK